MIKEKYSIKSKTVTLSVTNGAISAIQKSNTTKTGLRLYDNGCIGIAGAIGSYDEQRLTSHAEQMLKFKIPYDCSPAKDIKRGIDLTGRFSLSDEDFLSKSEELLSKLTREFPQFMFSHKIVFADTETSLENDCGADLSFKDKMVQVGLLIKHKKSKDLMDSMGIEIARGFDIDAVFKSVTETCACFEEKVGLPEEKMPVVLLQSPEILLVKFFSDLNGRVMGTGASMFSEKLGQKLFSDDFSLRIERFPAENYHNFFDAEGAVLENDSFTLIENGIFKSPFSAKKVAKEYGYDVTCSAAADYDSVPDTSFEGIKVQSSGKTIKELLNGRKAIYVVMAGGGDFTAQGEYASPIQSAFLFDGQNLLGRLPQLSMRSNIYDMFGKDFIGASTDGNSPGSPFKYLAIDMNVSKIGDWL